MNKIKIKKNTLGDSRTANKIPTFEEFSYANILHKHDVQNMMFEISERLKEIGDDHDFTKMCEPYSSKFYLDLCNSINGKMNFEDGEWWGIHCDFERHHLSEQVPDNVNLFDIIEMIVDCVCAGMARSGESRPLKLDESVLTKAVNNTVKVLENIVELQE